MYQPKPNDFYALIEAMPLCIILHDAHTKEILWANAAALAALGFTLEELTPLKAPDMTRDAPKYRRSVGLRWLEGAARTGQRAIEVLSLKAGRGDSVRGGGDAGAPGRSRCADGAVPRHL